MSSLDVLTLALQGRHLIEASAGTGKTYAITSIVLRLLLGHLGSANGQTPRAIEQILIVTFTRAATEELRARIRKRLRAARLAFAEDAATSEDELIAALRAASSDLAADRKHLALAEMNLDLANILTIHGFATRMLQRNAFESGASFSAEIEEDNHKVVEEALRDVWRERVYPLAVLPASFVLAKWDAAAFVKRARGLLGKPELRFAGLPQASWQQLLGEMETAGSALAKWWAQNQDTARELLRGISLKKKGREALEHSVTALDAARDGSINRSCVSGLDRALLESELTARPVNNCLPECAIFDLAQAVLRSGQQVLARLLFDTRELALERLAALKARTAMLGYDDLLRLLDEGLAAPHSGARLAAAIREQFPVALIDECQDTDQLQWRVFERIYSTPDCGLFLVGDPKQAIYAFRGADVYAYLKVRREADNSYTLDRNYRSVEPLICALNALFQLRTDGDPFMAQGGMPYVEVLPSHNPDKLPLARAGQALPALQLLVEREPQPLSLGEYRVRMARQCARHIAGLLADPAIRLGDEALAAGDIACLVRGWPDATVLARALERHGIPYVYRGRESVYASAEALDLYQLLAAVLGPGSERALRGALGCALLGYDATELAAVLGDEHTLLAKQQEFLLHARRLREQGVHAALRRLLLEHAVPARLLAQADGERRLTNCLHLLELLQEERESLDSDEALLARLAERIATADGEREEQQLRLESDARRVQIVTLHSSKGLEYPVVYLPFPAQYREADEALWHDAQTLEPWYDLNGAADALQRADRERLAEDMRLLYVGLTRAIHCCVIGFADTVRGRSKQSGLAQSAIGYLLAADSGEASEALERLTALPGAVVFDSESVGPTLRAQEPPASELAARVFDVPIERDWSMSSYSSLVRSLPERAERAFRQPELAGAGGTQREGRDWSLFAFERGAEAGSFLHGLIERIDLALPGAAPPNRALIAAALTRSGRAPQWQAALEQMIDDVRGCALDGARLQLASIPAARRVTEMGFELPLAMFATPELNRLLQQYEPLAARGVALGYASVKGMLSGFIDLVFEHEGRYFVADFKSNHLGERHEDYVPARIEDSIVEHRYDLQYVLYSVALQRYLRARLNGAYDPDTHLGGVYYLYLRGMRADAGAAHGVFHTRPPQALIDALDLLFAGEPS